MKTEMEVYDPKMFNEGLLRNVSVSTRSKKTVEVDCIAYDGKLIYQGDIIIAELNDSESDSASLIKTGHIWTDKKIPYVISCCDKTKSKVEEAITQFNATFTCLQFVKKEDKDTDYVDFVDGKGCSSYVGKVGKRQPISIASWAIVGNVLHEMCHCAGVYHEHTRHDRDQYVEYKKENVTPEAAAVNFEICSLAKDFGNYDYGSIMHYSRYGFAKKGKETLIPKEKVKIGQRDHLSDKDIAGINDLYK